MSGEARPDRLTVEKREEGQPFPSASAGEHSHNAHELLYILEGAAEVTVGDRRYVAEAGAVVLFSRLEAHRVRPMTDRYSRYILTVPPAVLHAAPGGERLGTVFVNRPAGFSHCLTPPDGSGTLEPLFDALCREAEEERAFSGERMTCLLGELLIALYRLCPADFSVPAGRSDETVRQVKAYIDEHFAEPIAVGDLAQRFYLSNCYLSHVFRRVTGYTLKQYLLLCRLAEARSLLCHTNDPVGEIALRVGFADANNFIRYFRQQVGTTPNQYRRHQRQTDRSDG